MVSRKPSGKVTSGSPQTGEPEYLLVGTIGRTHGVRGAMVMRIQTDFPDRIKSNMKLYLGDLHRPAVLQSTRPHNQGLVIKLTGVDTPEQAESLRNQSLYVRTADRPRLAVGEFYHYQLLGHSVVNEAGDSIGILSEILQTGANDVYVVRRPDGSEVLLPAIPSVILSIDQDRHFIRIREMPGLLEGSE